MDWPEALAFCEGLDLAGAGDWRLPNAKELQSLVDYTRSPRATNSAAIDPLFEVTRITDEAGRPNYPGYWTSTTHLDGRRPGTDAAVVYFGEALGALSRPGGGNDRMVRPGPGSRPESMMGSRERRPPPPRGTGGAGFSGSAQQPSAPIIDVHGAGAQRSDPKIGDPDVFPISGQGPQGDVRRVHNYVRCARGAG